VDTEKKQPLIKLLILTKKHIIMKNVVGIDKNKAEELNQILNQLLADYEVFYQNLRGFHWNIKGREFFELHTKFEELYNDAFIKIDEIAERILTLEGEPLHTYTDYLKVSNIKESKNVTNGVEGVKIIVKNFSTIITIERKILDLAGDANDEGTVSLMSDYISQTEKTLWMLNSYLK
jgi:starvation-inducible DNA-binding protein